MSVRLSKRVVDAAVPEAKDRYLWDSSLKGFGVKVTPKGRKVYLVQYRIGGRKGRTRRFTIGAHGTLTAEEARTLGKRALGLASSGEDPSAQKDKVRDGHSMNDMLDKFDEMHISTRLKESTQGEYRRNMRLHIKPRIGHMLVHQVTRQDMMRLHHSLKDHPYRANRVLALLSKFFNWCEKFGYRDDGRNPCRFVEKYKEEKRQRFLSAAEQLRLTQVLNDAKRDGLATDYAIYAIRLLRLTGARLGEILHLKWEYINWEKGTLDLPDSKTGKKTIYLNEPARDILSEIVRLPDNPYVCCGLVPRARIVDLQKPWRRIRAKAGLDDVRIHDLRHTFASVAVSNGLSLPMIGALLGHSQPTTTARYAHLASDPLIEAAEMIGRRIEG